MTAEGHKVVALHSDLEVSVRDRVIDAFRSGDAKVLITTNVLARGIDVQSVSIVINYVCHLSSHLSISFICISQPILQPHSSNIPFSCYPPPAYPPELTRLMTRERNRISPNKPTADLTRRPICTGSDEPGDSGAWA